MEGINWDFIAQPGIEGEATHLTGYVPTDTSGFTIGSFDLGQHSEEDLRRILQSYQNKLGKTYPLAETTELYKSISPYALREDISDEEARKISFEKEDIEYLTAAKRHEFERSLSKLEGWENLNPKMQTILASVGWQYGTDKSTFKDLYKLRGNEGKMINKLINMGSAEYKHRRTKEAEYMDPIFLEMLMKDNPVGYYE